MLRIFAPIRGFIKFTTVSIDNNVSRLHYRATVVILAAFSLIVSSNQYFGEPISCMSVNSISYKVIDTYCWITSTFIVPSDTGTVGKDIIDPGIGAYNENKDKISHQKYYQWISLCLFFQALLFYAPRYIWKSCEGRIIQALIVDLDRPIVKEDHKAERIKVLVYYFRKNMDRNNFYAWKFFTCELLNFINLLCQIRFVNYFLGGEFFYYGWEVLRALKFEADQGMDPMDRIFPKVGKCSFYTYGMSGSMQKFDALCVLSLNVINEKIYFFLWFWFAFLLVVNVLNFMYRIAIMASPWFRYIMLRGRSMYCSPLQIRAISYNFNVDNWLIFYRLSRNIDSSIYPELVDEMYICLYSLIPLWEE